MERAMAKTLNLKIITPEKLFYEGDVEIAIVRTVLGEEGFMAGHSPCAKLLAKDSNMFYRPPGSKGGDRETVKISGGFVKVDEGEAVVFTDRAEG
jgi:F-type H+-transporting ATPase subunit epsilon